MRQDVNYLLTRLEGQLARLNLVTNGLYWHEHDAMREAVVSANQFAIQLREKLEDNHHDVV